MYLKDFLTEADLNLSMSRDEWQEAIAELEKQPHSKVIAVASRIIGTNLPPSTSKKEAIRQLNQRFHLKKTTDRRMKDTGQIF